VFGKYTPSTRHIFYFIFKENVKMTKAITKNSKKGFTLVELVIVIAILAILAAIAIPVVNSIINTASKNSALSNAETIELAVKNCQADIAARNSEVYNGTTQYMAKGATSPSTCNNAAKNDATGTGYQKIDIKEVAGMNAINDALDAVTYNNAVFDPFWDKDTDSVVFVCTTAGGDIAVGAALTKEGVQAGYATTTEAGQTSFDASARKVRLANNDTIIADIPVYKLSGKTQATTGGTP
jgi:prepilin-type N-terminal cleavage/methylation domain-containing protein